MSKRNYTMKDFPQREARMNRIRREKSEMKRNRVLGIVGAVLFCIAYGRIGTMEYNDQVVMQAHAESRPAVQPMAEETEPPSTRPVSAVDVQIETPTPVPCNLSFKDVRSQNRAVVSPPQWFSEMFAEYGVKNCAKQRWMSQIAYYESRYCNGSTANCPEIVGAAKDSGLFQYIPSTWASAWNPERHLSIFDAKAQFRATSIKYDLGGQTIWSTNKLTRK